MPNTRDAWGERLPRQLGFRGGVALVVMACIGGSIFRVPANTSVQLGHLGPVLLVWLLGGVVALCGALSLAELAAAIPRSGGLFTFIFEAYGPLPAFAYGWAELIVIAPAGGAAAALVFVEYLGFFFRFNDARIHHIAAAALLAVGLLNYLGVRFVSVVTTLTTVVVYGGLACLALLAFVLGSGNTGNFAPIWVGGLSPSLMATALVAVMFTYDGWADLSRVAGEMREPARNLPRAMILGTALVVVIYLAINVAYIYLVPIEQMRDVKLIAAEAAARIPVFGAAAGALAALLVAVSCFGNLCEGTLVMPRTQFAMAERGLFLRYSHMSHRASRRHPLQYGSSSEPRCSTS